MQRGHIWQLLAGISLFLFALDIIEGVAKASNDVIRRKIESFTNTTVKAFLTWVGVINVLQSTHAVSLLLLALVGSGLIGLHSAVGVVLWMNVGAVFTEALIWLFGLWFSLKPYVMPMVAIGGLGAMFVKRWRSGLMILFAIGLTFFGLELLKESVGVMKEFINVSAYANLGRWWFILIGSFAAIMVQSSSAVTIIVMTAVLGGLISFPSACAMLMGAYVGSATTALAVAFSGTSAVKKQVALSHLLFNVITSIIFIIWFPRVIDLIQNIWGFGTNEARFAWLEKTWVNGLIVFFLLFKLVWGLIHLPFVKQFTALIKYIAPDDKVEHLGIDHIDTKLDVYTKFTIMKNDLKQFNEQIGVLAYQRIKEPETYDETLYYEKKKIYDKLFRFMVVFPFGELQLAVNSETHSLDALQETMQSLKIAKNAQSSLRKIVKTVDIQTKAYWDQIITYLDELYTLINKGDYDIAREKIVELAAWDEKQMKVIIDAGKEVSADLVELFQIHDHLHEAAQAFLESRELITNS